MPTNYVVPLPEGWSPPINGTIQVKKWGSQASLMPAYSPNPLIDLKYSMRKNKQVCEGGHIVMANRHDPSFPDLSDIDNDRLANAFELLLACTAYKLTIGHVRFQRSSSRGGTKC